MRIRTNERRACISAIQAAEGKICTTPEEINTVFLDFYKNLYISEISFSTDEFRHFFSDLNLGKLPSLEAEDLGDSISLK